MKYITTSGPTVESLSLGALGQTKTFVITGAATFADGSKALSVTGIQNVPIHFSANLSLKPTLVEVSVEARRIETYCVVSAASERWTSAAMRGIGNHIGTDSTGISVINLVTNAEITLATPSALLDPWLDYVLVPDVAAKSVWALRTGTTATAPVVGRAMQMGSAPIAVGINRSTTDQRTHIVVDADGALGYFGHQFQQVKSNTLVANLVSAAFTYAGNVITGVVFCDQEGKLRRAAFNAALDVGPIQLVDSDRRWMRVQTDPTDRSRVICVSDAATDNAFTLGQSLTPTFAGLAYSGLGVTDTGYAHGFFGSVSTDTGPMTPAFTSVVGQLLYPAAGAYLITDGTRYAAGALTGSVPAGRTLLGVIYLSGVAHAICSKGTPPTLRTNSAQHTTTLTITSKLVEGSTITIEIDVAGTAGIDLEFNGGEGFNATYTVEGQPVATVRAGQKLKVVFNAASVRDNLFAIAVGRNALVEALLPDELPDAFVIENIYGLDSGVSQTTVPVTPLAYDTPIPVHSNGIIVINGVEVPDGTLIRPGQSLAIKVTQSEEFLNHWWVTTGALRVEFVSAQQDQPVTTAIKSRAYMPLGKFVSRQISNSFDRSVILQLGDIGEIQDRTQRTIVLGPGQVAHITLDIIEHKHYEIPYTFGRSEHMLQVWADDHFLDPEPVTAEADRFVAAQSPAFSFASIPDDFYVKAKTPAGVLVALDGELLAAPADARSYNHDEEELEFDVVQPLSYMAIPFADGRTLDFGDVVARWTYDPAVSSVIREKQSVWLLPKQEPLVVVLQNLEVPRVPVADNEPSTFALYPMRKHQEHPSAASNSFAGWDVDMLAAAEVAGIKAPNFGHNEFTISDVGRAVAAAADNPEIRTFDNLDFQIVAPTRSEFESRDAQRVMPEHYSVESGNFTYIERVTTDMKAAEYAEVRPHQAQALSLIPNPVTARTSEGLEVYPNWTPPTAANAPDALDATSVQYRVSMELELEVNVVKARSAEVLELHSAQMQITGLTSWKSESYTVEQPISYTIPIRPLYRGVNRNSVDIQARSYVYPRAYSMADPIPGVSYNARAKIWQLEITASQMHVGVPVTARALEAVAIENLTRDRDNALPSSMQLLRVTRQGTDAAFTAASATSSHTQREGEYVQRSVQSFEARKIIFNLATTHDGNPDLLDRGYFATELEALQNAVNVWHKDPADVVARQIPTLQWYWATPDVCVNMCDACPPYGYLSGG